LFRKAGGNAIIEVSSYGLARNCVGLKEISARTGVKIIAGTGFYLKDSLTSQQRQMTVGQMYDVMMRDITEGFPGTSIRAGIIGEVAVSSPLTGIEKRSLTAAARAHRDSNLALNIHIGTDKELCKEVIAVLKAEKANLRKVSFAHCDGPAPLEVYRMIMDEGIYVEIDCFGYELYVDNGAYDSDYPFFFPSDSQRVQCIRMLLDNHLGAHLLISQDVAYKSQTVRYGGYGYAHILDNVVPMFESAGVPQDQVRRMMSSNVHSYLMGT
jgi:phosphotriesterase-related protein